MSESFVLRKLSIGRRTAFWAPTILFLLCLGVLIILWRAMINTEQHRLELSTDITAEQVQLRIEAWIDDRAAILSHFAKMWLDFEPEGRMSFYDEAMNVLDLYPGFQALNYIDRDWVIRIVTPHRGNQQAFAKDLHDHPFASVPEALQQASETGRIVRTSLIELLQGEIGFATYVPITRADGSLNGFINGVFRVSDLIDSCLAEDNLRNRFCYALIGENDQIAYTHNWSEIGSDQRYLRQRDVRIVDRAWKLKLAPSREELRANSSSADEILIIVGVVLSLILAIVLRVLIQRQVELGISRENYRLLVENQADLVIKLDRDFRIIFASPAFCRFAGRQEPELSGRNISETIHAEDREAGESHLNKLMSTSESCQFELRGLGVNGVCWLAISASTITDAHGNVEGLICVGRDITQRRELENQLRKSQKLQAVGQLAGGIAHDFNNIIQAIKGYLEFVKADLEPGTQTYDDIEEAGHAADRAASLTRQLLAFSKQQVNRPENLDLNDVITDILSMLRRVIGESIRLDFSQQPDLDLVQADRGQIEQILVNLCVNARDAIQGDGTIQITTVDIDLDETFCSEHPGIQPGNYVMLGVRDTGVGMAEDLQKQIFDPFFTTKETGTGTGLGLATLYGIVQQHKGLVLVESAVGQGTTMRVYLPATVGLRSNTQSLRKSDFPGGPEMILIAEDEEVVRKVAVRILEKAGYLVLEAADGLEAMEILTKRITEIDLVFMDVMMPGLTGREVSHWIRREHPGIRILLTSGYDSESVPGIPDQGEGIKVLPKPYNQALLLKTVREILDGED